MIAKTVKPATMKVQADDRAELVALIEVAEENGFELVGKIAKMTGVYVANLIQVDYEKPIYTPSNEEEEEATLTAEEAALYNEKKPLTGEAALKEGDPKPADFDEVVNG